MRQRYEKLKKLKLERKEISLAEQALNPHNHRKSSSPRARGGFVSRSPKFKSKSSSSKSKGGSSGAAVKFRPVFDTNTSTTLEPSTNMTVTGLLSTSDAATDLPRCIVVGVPAL